MKFSSFPSQLQGSSGSNTELSMRCKNLLPVFGCQGHLMLPHFNRWIHRGRIIEGVQTEAESEQWSQWTHHVSAWTVQLHVTMTKDQIWSEWSTMSKFGRHLHLKPLFFSHIPHYQTHAELYYTVLISSWIQNVLNEEKKNPLVIIFSLPHFPHCICYIYYI